MEVCVVTSLSMSMTDTVPLADQVAALILLSFSSPPIALIALSTMAVASLSSARRGLVTPDTRATANRVLKNLVMVFASVVNGTEERDRAGGFYSFFRFQTLRVLPLP